MNWTLKYFVNYVIMGIFQSLENILGIREMKSVEKDNSLKCPHLMSCTSVAHSSCDLILVT